MKKLLLLPLLALLINSCATNQTTSDEFPEKLQRIFSFEPAIVIEKKLTIEDAAQSAQTLFFAAPGPQNQNGIFHTEALPTLVQKYGPYFWRMPHINITGIYCKGQVYGIFPHHIFGEYSLPKVLVDSKFKRIGERDIVVAPFGGLGKKQKPLEVLFTNKSKMPIEIDGARCLVKGLNAFPGDSSLYSYEITGKLHYISEDEKSWMESRFGNLQLVSGNDMFIIIVPAEYFDRLDGISGSSVVYNDHLLGIINARYYFTNPFDQSQRCYFYTIERVFKEDICD